MPNRFRNTFSSRGVKRFQSAVDLALQVIANGRFQRRHGLLVFDEVAQMAVFFFTDRRFERDRLPRDF